MRIITKRELNQNTASVLDLVTPADDVVITERGKPRWRVAWFQDLDTPLARLEREGRYTKPLTTAAPWPAQPSGPTYSDEDFSALLDEMHGEL